MKNKKKVYYKNRVKCFYTEPEKHVPNRIKDLANLNPEESDKEEDDNFENPEEESDLS